MKRRSRSPHHRGKTDELTATLPVESVPSTSPYVDTTTGYMYITREGDTLGSLACRFHLPIFTLVQANPELQNPATMAPGLELHIPLSGLSLPYCVLLHPAGVLLPTQRPVGSVMFWRTSPGDIAVTFTGASLPSPATLGPFDTFLGCLEYTDKPVATILHECAGYDQPTAWCGTRILTDLTQVPHGRLIIFPFHTVTALSGSAVLLAGSSYDTE